MSKKNVIPLRQYGKINVGRNWLLVRRRPRNGLEVALHCVNDAELALLILALHGKSDSLADATKVQVHKRWWLLRRRVGTQDGVGVGWADTEGAIDALLGAIAEGLELVDG